MAGDRPSQEGKDEPEYPKPRSSSQVTPSLGRPLWIGLGYCPRMWTLDHGGSSHQVWLPARGGDGRSHPLQMDLDQPQWRAQDKDTEGDPVRTDIKDRLDETRGIKPDTHSPPGDAFPYWLSSGVSVEFKPWWFYCARDWVDPA